MTAPKTLGTAGKALWKAVVDDLPEDWELDPRELEILGLAARQADDLTLLEASIAKVGAMVTGSTGQPTVNPAIPEARQARMAISRLIGSLGLPDENEEPKTKASERASSAAKKRWADVERKRLHLAELRGG